METKLQKEENYYSKILNIRLKIHPIFIPELKSMINKNTNTGKIIRGKDLIVILGVSGAGKSTLTQFLFGYKLIERKRKGKTNTLVP